ncbi:hypothetical protein [Frankia sp. AgW1.1]|uniref:hypothetical protein n=1 Tax=Frankia sp. AgW1.1 TaxID=1836971 RepID=UPI001EE48793|nr:hypothetical protein [Frankia sp. AgW1.1]MBL7487201.1 hypothetical protein [Frankia sp. AgW1.1]
MALAFGEGGWAGYGDPAEVLTDVEGAIGPRWVWWSARGAGSPLAGGWRESDQRGPALSWDLAAVHRILRGGHRDDPGAVWAATRGLPVPPPPQRARGDGQLDLLAMVEQPDDAGDVDDPVGPDGQLRLGWVDETLGAGARPRGGARRPGGRGGGRGGGGGGGPPRRWARRPAGAGGPLRAARAGHDGGAGAGVERAAGPTGEARAAAAGAADGTRRVRGRGAGP